MINRILGGMLRLPLAKFVDTFGRPRGLFMTMGVITFGLVLQAAAQNLATTAIAQVFQGIGLNCMDYIFTVLLVDMTSLKNRSMFYSQHTCFKLLSRTTIDINTIPHSIYVGVFTDLGITTGLAYGIFVTPTIVASFASPKIAELLYTRISWRWVFGASSVIFVGLFSPLAITLVRAGRSGQIPDHASRVEDDNRSPRSLRTLRSFLVELDLPGIILAVAGLCLILLPFNLASTVESGWRNAKLISMLVVGPISIISFIVWEKRLAPVGCITWDLLRNRNVLGGCLAGLLSVGSLGCWEAYYSSYLQVVHNQGISTSGYITNAFPLSFAFSAPFLGM